MRFRRRGRFRRVSRRVFGGRRRFHRGRRRSFHRGRRRFVHRGRRRSFGRGRRGIRIGYRM